MPSTAEAIRPVPMISAAPQTRTTHSPARKTAHKPLTVRRIQPQSRPAPIVLAKVKAESAVIPAPVSTPAPAIIPTPAAETPQTSLSQHSPHQVTLYTGLLIPVRLVEALSSEKNQPGDTFTATVDHEIVVDGFVIVERGAMVEGRVTAVDRGSARLTVELTRLNTADRQRLLIETESFERRIDTPSPTGENGMRSGPATLPADTRIRFRLRTSILLTEKLG